jgi:hypothetical protein
MTNISVQKPPSSVVSCYCIVLTYLPLPLLCTAAGAPSEISAPLIVRSTLEASLTKGSVSINMFDNAQKHVFAIVRLEIVPKFVQHLREKKEKQQEVNAEKKLALKASKHSHLFPFVSAGFYVTSSLVSGGCCRFDGK